MRATDIQRIYDDSQREVNIPGALPRPPLHHEGAPRQKPAPRAQERHQPRREPSGSDWPYRLRAWVAYLLLVGAVAALARFMAAREAWEQVLMGAGVLGCPVLAWLVAPWEARR